MPQLIRVLPGDGDALQCAFDRAMPGDVVELQPGEHRHRATIRRGGRKGAPITLRAQSGAILRGPDLPADRNLYRMGIDGLPSLATWAMLRVIQCGHLRFEGLSMRSCWPTGVYAEDAWDLTFEGCDVEGGSYPFFLRDTQPKNPRARDVTVRRCRWTQDERIWQGLAWQAVHDEDGGAYHLNGAMLGTADILGDIVFEANEVTDAFNALRIDVTRRLRENFPEELPRRNRNIFVFDNRFTRIRDNVLEPESWAFNMHFHHNEIRDAHAPLSLDGVGGGYWYIYANRFWFESRQGSVENAGSRGGKIIKLAGYPDHPRFAWYFFNNSIYCRSSVIGDGDSGLVPVWNLRFRDNAIGSCEPNSHPDDAGDVVCARTFKAIEVDLDIRSGTEFAGVLTNATGAFAARLGRDDRASQKLLLPQGTPLFVAPERGDFRLVRDSPGLRSGRGFTIALPDGESFEWPARLDIGAAQSDGSPLPQVPMRCVP